MKYIAEIDVMPLPALLDPQGKTVSASMKNLGLHDISNVRIGKHITLTVEGESEIFAREKVKEACKRLLVNEIMEFYTIKINSMATATP